MPQRPLQFSLATVFGAVTLAAIALGIARFGGERIVWGVSSVIGLICCGIAIAFVGGRSFGFSIAGGSSASLLAYLIADFFPEPYDIVVISMFAFLVWACWAYIAAGGLQAFRLLQIAIGLTWSFLGAPLLLISIQNARVSVNWPAVIPTLVLAPLVFFLSMVPFWAVRRWRRSTRLPTKRDP